MEYAIVSEGCEIQEGASVGQRPEHVNDKDSWGIAVVANDVTVGKGAVVPAKVMIDQDVPTPEEVSS